jgi:hypothetical protein
MSENSKSLKIIERMVKTAFFSTVSICVIYIVYIWLRYIDDIIIVDNLRFSILILLIGGILTFILCLLLLLNLPLLIKRRKEPGAKRGILITAIAFIIAMFYITPCV